MAGMFGVRPGLRLVRDSGRMGHGQTGLMEQCGFRAPAFLWLPVGLVTFAVLRFRPAPATWESMLLMWTRSLTPVAPLTWTAGAGLGAATVAGSLVAGLLGPIAIAAWALVISLPAWIAGWWLARRA